MRDLVQQSVSSLETTTVTRESPFVKQYPNNKYPEFVDKYHITTTYNSR